MSKKGHITTETQAHCLTCDRLWETNNAHPVGVIHARTHKHHVVVRVTQVHSYDYTEETKDDK